VVITYATIYCSADLTADGAYEYELKGHGYRDELVIPIIENTPSMNSDSVAETVCGAPCSWPPFQPSCVGLAAVFGGLKVALVQVAAVSRRREVSMPGKAPVKRFKL
jgi:hypothetical protein